MIRFGRRLANVADMPASTLASAPSTSIFIRSMRGGRADRAQVSNILT